jgi:hypothetical protein
MSARSIAVAVLKDFLSQPVLGQMQIGFVIIGALFWAQAMGRPEAFDVNMYGRFALMFRAEFWAAAMMAPAAMCWVGLQNPVKRWMVAVGASLQTAQFLALAYSAIVTGGEPIIGYFCSVLFAPLYFRMAWEAARNVD